MLQVDAIFAKIEQDWHIVQNDVNACVANDDVVTMLFIAASADRCGRNDTLWVDVIATPLTTMR